MSKPEDIPQDIWDRAESITKGWFGFDYTPDGLTEYNHSWVIAEAILAERERCAAIAETRSPDDDNLDWQVRQQVARAIRDPQV